MRRNSTNAFVLFEKYTKGNEKQSRLWSGAELGSVSCHLFSLRQFINVTLVSPIQLGEA